LNEETGELEYQEVEVLMDMGIQEVLELTTRSGKSIKTTDNHPYLVLLEGRQSIFSGGDSSQAERERELFFNENAYAGPACNDRHTLQREQKRPWPLFQSKPQSLISSFRLNEECNYKKDNSQHRQRDAQPEGKVDEKFACQSHSEYSFRDICPIPGRKFSSRMVNHGLHDTLNVPQRRENVKIGLWYPARKQTKWLKVKYLSVGQKIATVDGWEEIVSITPQGRQETYDIQVANTHNFVGNGIIAHNTFLAASSGNVGIGTTSPSAPLHLNAASAIFGVGILDATPAASLTVGSGDLFQVDSSGRAFLPAGASGAGNLALSTTGDTNTGLYFSAADEIRIQTGASDRVTINSSGNVGVGTTVPGAPLHVTGQCVTGDTLLRRRRRKRSQVTLARQ